MAGFPQARSTGWTEQLVDGTIISIRPIDRHTADLELEFLTHLSPEFRSARFLGLVRDPTPEVARQLTNLDPDKAAGFMAVVAHDGREHQIGAAQFHVSLDGDACDAALTVSGEWRKRGVGSRLMRHLLETARQRGIRRVRAHVSEDTGSGDHLALRLGFQRRQDRRDPAAVVYELAL